MEDGHMRCLKVRAARERLLDPLAAEWSSVGGEAVPMTATPLANQPSEYIKASRDAREVGKVRNLLVQAAHDGREIFVRLTWEDATQNREITDTNVFPDGCGILLPLAGGDPPIEEMGSRSAPVNAWFWRADFKDKPRNTIAHGLGTTQFSTRSALEARSSWGNGAWAIVFARPLAVAEQKDETVQLAPGQSVRVGFAVWEGSNGERAGVKSFSKEWRELALDA
jgi:DMSO reductase family type II enzyme heme b subunit